MKVCLSLRDKSLYWNEDSCPLEGIKDVRLMGESNVGLLPTRSLLSSCFSPTIKVFKQKLYLESNPLLSAHVNNIIKIICYSKLGQKNIFVHFYVVNYPNRSQQLYDLDVMNQLHFLKQPIQWFKAVLHSCLYILNICILNLNNLSNKHM